MVPWSSLDLFLYEMFYFVFLYEMFYFVDGTMGAWAVRGLKTDYGPPEKQEVTWSGRVSETKAPMSSLTLGEMA